MGYLEDMLKKKGGEAKPMDEKYKAAKMGVLQHIGGMADNAMGKDLHQLHKVTVGSTDHKGLEEGLKKAEELVGKEGDALHTNDMDDSEDSMMDKPNHHTSGEKHESPVHAMHPGAAESALKSHVDEEAEEGDMSDAEIDDLIQHLQSKKKGK